MIYDFIIQYATDFLFLWIAQNYNPWKEEFSSSMPSYEQYFNKIVRNIIIDKIRVIHSD